MKKFLLLIGAVFLFISCNDDDDTTFEELPSINGLAISQSENNFGDTYEAIRSNLNTNQNISVVAEIDHKNNASAVGVELSGSRVVLFGNPNLGTPLMQENQLAGLDLPQKILVYQDHDNVFAAYNTTAYLASRYDLNIESEALSQVSSALSDLIVSGTNVVPTLPDEGMVASKEGIITVASNQPFNATYSSLKAAIDSNTNLRTITELDHQANGASVGKVIRPTRLIIFGNPNLGTPLIEDAPSMAIDLPQKILVWQDDAGVTQISYNDPAFLARRHNINGNTETLTMITDALAALSEAASN